MHLGNFTLIEVAHRTLPGHLKHINYAAMQYLQTVRNAGCRHFKKDIGLRITSGYRELAYNRKIKSGDRSYHIWRMGGSEVHAKDLHEEIGRPLFANDFQPIGVETEEYFEWMCEAFPYGELYFHERYDFIHSAPNAVTKKPWTQR